ncbi:hypothetical protein [Clostridium beijerinckii]|uniref:hypothetical protein n=2 Tax=Clostridium beijerinckii TaxID=1520 RepID=UPI0009CCDB14|nr:hypothetical protein [Clostridium beijerinckii]OOM48581.1 hypothetical protein CBEIJ_22040 [Clostridium beijerinckii]
MYNKFIFMHIGGGFRKKEFKIRKSEGLAANDLIEILKNYPRDTKVCTQMLEDASKLNKLKSVPIMIGKIVKRCRITREF